MKRQNLLQNGLKQIAKIQNFSQNELDQITKMQNLPQNELEEIAKMRRIRKYKKISMEELLIALLNSSRNLYEGYKSNSNNARIEEIIKNFNRLGHKSRRPKNWKKAL